MLPNGQCEHRRQFGKRCADVRLRRIDQRRCRFRTTYGGVGHEYSGRARHEAGQNVWFEITANDNAGCLPSGRDRPGPATSHSDGSRSIGRGTSRRAAATATPHDVSSPRHSINVAGRLEPLVRVPRPASDGGGRRYRRRSLAIRSPWVTWGRQTAMHGGADYDAAPRRRTFALAKRSRISVGTSSTRFRATKHSCGIVDATGARSRRTSQRRVVMTTIPSFPLR